MTCVCRVGVPFISNEGVMKLIEVVGAVEAFDGHQCQVHVSHVSSLHMSLVFMTHDSCLMTHDSCLMSHVS